MSEVTLHEDADEEFKAAAVFYESRRSGLGEMFVQRVVEGFESILVHPLSGQVLFDGPTTPYPANRLLSCLSDRRRPIFVLAIAHWSRNPGYWKARI